MTSTGAHKTLSISGIYTYIHKETKPIMGHRPKRLRMLAEFPHCFWCDAHVNEDNSTVDHIAAKHKGGTGAKHNLVLSCFDCNNERGHQDPWTFYMKKQPIRAQQTPPPAKRQKVLHTMTAEMKSWLEAESESSGRSVSWLIENAVNQWRSRLEYGRKRNTK